MARLKKFLALMVETAIIESLPPNNERKQAMKEEYYSEEYYSDADLPAYAGCLDAPEFLPAGSMVRVFDYRMASCARRHVE